MQQSFEFYVVDPISWKDVSIIENVKSCTIKRDLDSQTLGSATIDIEKPLDECYIRIYLITVQNKIKEKHPFGTFLVQTPHTNFDGRSSSVSLDAYTPLIELKENKPPIGYFVAKQSGILSSAYTLTREKVRAPVVEPSISAQSKKIQNDFISDPNETWLDYLQSLLANANHMYQLDEMGRILFAPVQFTESLQPKWLYNDSNSILYPEITTDHDVYGIPNVVEVIYSNGSSHYYARVTNDNPNSPISTITRGREIVYRETNPNFAGEASERDIRIYAENLLKELSTVEYTISYTHGYTPTTIGDCVLLEYKQAGLDGIKAKIKSQSIKCEPGCPVTETAVFTERLWR